MRKSGFIIVLLFASIFCGIGITRTHGLTEVIYEGDWIINTNTEILETDQNITVKGNLIIFFTVQLISHSQINVLGDLIIRQGDKLPWYPDLSFVHYARINVYGNLYINQKMASYGDIFVNNSIILEEGELRMGNDILIEAKDINLTNTSRILNNVGAGFGVNTTIITGDLIIENRSILLLQENSNTYVKKDMTVGSDSIMHLDHGSLNIGGIFNITAEVSIMNSVVSINQSLYTDDLGMSPNAKSLYVNNSIISVSNSIIINRYTNIFNSKIIQTNSQFDGHFIESYAITGFRKTEMSSYSDLIYNENSSLVIESCNIKYDGDENTITSMNLKPEDELLVRISKNIFNNPVMLYSEGYFEFVGNSNFDTKLFSTGSTIINQNTGDLNISIRNINNSGVLQVVENNIMGNINIENVYPDIPIDFQRNTLTHLSLENVTNLHLSGNTFEGSIFRDVVSAEIYNNTFLGTVSFEGRSQSNNIVSNSFADVTSTVSMMSNTTVKENTFGGHVSGIILITLPEIIYSGGVLDLSGLGFQLSYSFDDSIKIDGATEIIFPDTIGTHEFWLNVSLGSNSFVGSFMIEVVEVTIEPSTSAETQNETTTKTDESPTNLYSPLWYLVAIISVSIIRKRK